MKDFYGKPGRKGPSVVRRMLAMLTLLGGLGLVLVCIGAAISLCISLYAHAEDREERVAANHFPVEKAVDYAVRADQILSVYDADTFYIRIPECAESMPILCSKVGVRVGGVDAPEMRGKCEAEKQAATKARDVVVGLLGNAHSIVLHNLQHEKFGRLLADVEVDGLDLGKILLANGLVREYHGAARQGWCTTL